MTNTNDFASKLFAVFGAIAISATLFVSSFANPNTTTLSTLLV